MKSLQACRVPQGHREHPGLAGVTGTPPVAAEMPQGEPELTELQCTVIKSAVVK